MNHGNFSLLYYKMLDSSIWRMGTKEERLLWTTMMMMKDKDGIVQASVIGLADRARVTKDECVAALAVFMAPDVEDTSGVDEGRRIRVVPGGWQFINHETYRYSTEAKREFWRAQKAEQRKREEEAKKKKQSSKEKKAQKLEDKPMGPDAREQKAVRDEADGKITPEQLADDAAARAEEKKRRNEEGPL